MSKKPRNVPVFCRNFPNCQFGNRCFFQHPSPIICRNFPNCPFGEKCKFEHKWSPEEEKKQIGKLEKNRKIQDIPSCCLGWVFSFLGQQELYNTLFVSREFYSTFKSEPCVSEIITTNFQTLEKLSSHANTKFVRKISFQSYLFVYSRFDNLSLFFSFNHLQILNIKQCFIHDPLILQIIPQLKELKMEDLYIEPSIFRDIILSINSTKIERLSIINLIKNNINIRILNELFFDMISANTTISELEISTDYFRIRNFTPSLNKIFLNNSMKKIRLFRDSREGISIEFNHFKKPIDFTDCFSCNADLTFVYNIGRFPVNKLKISDCRFRVFPHFQFLCNHIIQYSSKISEIDLRETNVKDIVVKRDEIPVGFPNKKNPLVYFMNLLHARNIKIRI
jgi:hypothetical protein